MEDLNFDEKTDDNYELSEKTNRINKSLITFAKFDKFFLIPILLSIFNFLADLIEEIIDRANVLKNPEFIKSIIYDSNNVLAGLFYFISSFQVNVNIKNKSTNNEESNMVANYIYNKSLNTLINTKKDIIFILLLGLMLSIDDLLWALIGELDNIFEEKLFHVFFLFPFFLKLY